MGFLPCSFAIHSDPFLLVDHVAMNDLVKLEFLGPGSICMKDDLSVGKDLLGNGFPILLSNWSWTWGPLLGRSWFQFAQSQYNRKDSGLFDLVGLSFYLSFADVNLICLNILLIRSMFGATADLAVLHAYMLGHCQLTVGIDSLYSLVVNI